MLPAALPYTSASALVPAAVTPAAASAPPLPAPARRARRRPPRWCASAAVAAAQPGPAYAAARRASRSLAAASAAAARPAPQREAEALGVRRRQPRRPPVAEAVAEVDAAEDRRLGAARPREERVLGVVGLRAVRHVAPRVALRERGDARDQRVGPLDQSRNLRDVRHVEHEADARAAASRRLQRVQHARARVAALQQVEAELHRVAGSAERDLVEQRADELLIRGEELQVIVVCARRDGGVARRRKRREECHERLMPSRIEIARCDASTSGVKDNAL